jgi:hypothetical protein
LVDVSEGRKIDTDICIASIEDAEGIGRILQHLGLDRRADASQRLPAVRAPPSGSDAVCE